MAEATRRGLNAVVSARFARFHGRFGRVQFTNAATSGIRNYAASGFYIISYLRHQSELRRRIGYRVQALYEKRYRDLHLYGGYPAPSKEKEKKRNRHSLSRNEMVLIKTTNCFVFQSLICSLMFHDMESDVFS